MSQLKELQDVADPTMVKQAVDGSTQLERMEPFSTESLEELRVRGYDVEEVEASLFKHAVRCKKE